MPLGRLLYTNGGTHPRPERLLIIRNEQPFKNIQIFFYGFDVLILVIILFDVIS